MLYGNRKVVNIIIVHPKYYLCTNKLQQCFIHMHKLWLLYSLITRLSKLNSKAAVWLLVFIIGSGSYLLHDVITTFWAQAFANKFT